DAIAMTMRFGDFLALDNVELRVRPGTVHALLGENGAGKSTLVKCIAGYHRPDEGAVVVDSREREIADPVAARQRHGLPALHARARHDRGRKPGARWRTRACPYRLEKAARRARGVPGRDA